MFSILLLCAAVAFSSSDCEAEFQNAIRNRNFRHFWTRCDREPSFRSRCVHCHTEIPTASPTAAWIVGEWGPCSATCGNGVQTRDIQCPVNNDWQCGPAPEVERTCSEMECVELQPTSITCFDWNTKLLDCSRDISLLEQATGGSFWCDQYIFAENQGSLRAGDCVSQLEKLNSFDRRVNWHCAGGDKSFPTPGVQGESGSCQAHAKILNDILGGLIEHEPRVSCHDFDGYYMADGWDGDLSLSIYQRDDCTAEVCHFGGDSCVDNVLATDNSIMGSQLNDRGELVAHFTRDTVNFIHIKKEYCDQENYPCSEPDAYCGFGVNNNKCWCGEPDFPYACNKKLEDQWMMFKVDGQKSCTSECNTMGLTCSNNSPALDTRDAIDEVVESLGGKCLYFRGPWKGPWSPSFRPTDGRCMMKHHAYGQHCDEVLAYNPAHDSSSWDNRKLCYCSVEN